MPVQTVIFLFSYHVSKNRKNLLRVATHSGRRRNHSGGLTGHKGELPARCSGWLPVQTVIFLCSSHVSKDRKNLLRVATHSGRGQYHSGGLTEYEKNCLSARCSGWLPVQTIIFLCSSHVSKDRKNLLRVATHSGRGRYHSGGVTGNRGKLPVVAAGCRCKP